MAEPGKDGTAAHNPEQDAAPETVHGLSVDTRPDVSAIHAYSIEQARALVAAQVIGETIVVPVSRGTGQ